MDPITIAGLDGTVAQLIDTTSKVIRYINDVKNAPKERGKLAREVSNLLPLFTDLRYRIDESNSTDPWFHGLQSLGGKGSPLEAFQSTLEEIATKLEPKSNVRKVAQAFSWPLEKKEVEGLLARIERLKSLIGLALQKDNFKLAQAIKDDVSMRFDSLEIERDTTRIAEWLKAPDPSSNHNAARKKWQATTGEWFTNSRDFAQWKTVPNSFLWLHGIPGSGKTILCSTIIQNIVDICQQQPSTIVAYFYFDFNEPNKQCADSLLRSLLIQISAQSPPLLQLLQTAYRKSQNEQQHFSFKAMSLLLRQMLKGLRQTYIIYDALDECRDRDELHELITEIKEWNIGTLHMLATSRREKDIEDYLQSLVSCQVCIQSAQVDADIQVFIAEKLATDPKLKKWPIEAKGEIETSLMAGANGMFRWVFCQLYDLRKCLKLDALRKALATLPKTLDKTYERILSEIDEAYADDASKVLQWLCYSKRPMKLTELVDVLATDLGDTPQFNPDQRLPDPRDILTICSSLVSIMEEKDEWSEWSEWSRPQHYLQLAHFSVKEFLTSDRVKDATIQRYACNESSASLIIVKASLAYLTYFQNFDDIDYVHAEKFPLYHYAAENWTDHFKALVYDESRAQMDSLAIRFLESDNDCFNNWVRMILHRPSIYDTEGGILPHPLYYLSLLGFTELASLLLKKGANLVLYRKRYHCEHDSRLHELAPGSMGTTSRMPIYDKAGLNAPTGRYGTALQAASSYGKISTVKLLLDCGAKVNAPGGYFDSALQAASYEGNPELVQLLITRGADVNAKGGAFGNALRAACSSRMVPVVRILLDHGADVNAEDNNHDCALWIASYWSETQLVKMLLDVGASLDGLGKDGSHALQIAILKGHREVALLLLQRGANANAPCREQEV